MSTCVLRIDVKCAVVQSKCLVVVLKLGIGIAKLIKNVGVFRIFLNNYKEGINCFFVMAIFQCRDSLCKRCSSGWGGFRCSDGLVVASSR